MTPESYIEWRTARAGCITASDFKKVMAAKTPRAWVTILRNIRSEAAAIEQNIFTEQTAPALEWGRVHEKRALANYALSRGCLYEPAPFVRLGDLPIGASCDAYVEEDGLAEAKCPYSMDGFDRYVRDGVGSVLWQALGQLWITGRKWNDVVIFDPRRAEHDQLHVVRITASEHLEQMCDLQMRVTTFAGYLIDGTEPQGTKFAEAIAA